MCGCGLCITYEIGAMELEGIRSQTIMDTETRRNKNIMIVGVEDKEPCQLVEFW